MTTSPREPETPTPRPATRPRTIPLLALSPRRRSANGVLVSLVLHLALIFLILAPWALFQPVLNPGLAGLLGGGGGRGGGAKGGEYISISTPKVVTTRTPAPVPVPTPPPPPAVLTEVPSPVAPVDTTVSAPKGSAVAAPGQGGSSGKGPGSGGGAGSGKGSGSGSATGPGTGGNGGNGTPPENHTLLFPPDRGVPKDLRGRDVKVTFYVSATGNVLHITESPRIDDGKYRSAFLETMMAYRFLPARDSLNVPIPGTFEAVVTLGNR